MVLEEQAIETHPPEVALYRCTCKHCDTAVSELKRLCDLHGAKLTIKYAVQEPGMEHQAGWSTPYVYVNGKHVSHYSVNAQKWEQAILGELKASPLTMHGEVLDLVCYVKEEARGPAHKICADKCIKEGDTMGLLALDGQVYLLVKDRDHPEPYELLIHSAAEDVAITGELCRRGGLQAIIVQSVDRRHHKR